MLLDGNPARSMARRCPVCAWRPDYSGMSSGKTTGSLNAVKVFTHRTQKSSPISSGIVPSPDYPALSFFFVPASDSCQLMRLRIYRVVDHHLMVFWL